MACGPNLCNWHSSSRPKASRHIIPADQSGARARRGGGARGEQAAQLNRGERNLNPKHLWTRAERQETHTSRTHTPDTHTPSQRVSEGEVSAAVILLSGQVEVEPRRTLRSPKCARCVSGAADRRKAELCGVYGSIFCGKTKRTKKTAECFSS